MAMEGMALGETALAAGNGALFGRIAFTDGDWREMSLAQQGELVKAKFKNLEDQQRQRTMHPDTAFKYYYDEDGKRHVVDVNDAVGIGLLNTFGGGDVQYANRSRTDFKEGVYELDGMETPPPNYATALKQNEKLSDYATAVRNIYTKTSEQGKQGKIIIPPGARTA